MIHKRLLCGLMMILNLSHFIDADLEYDVNEIDSTLYKIQQPQDVLFVSKVEPKKRSNVTWNCDCYNSTDGVDVESECRCFGKELPEIPSNLGENLHRITVNDADLVRIASDSFQPYKSTLRDVILGNLPLLKTIETGTFRNIHHLRTLYISQAPQIKSFDGLFVGATAFKFLSLRIVNTGLIRIPDLSHLSSDHIVHMVELDTNEIEEVPANSVKIKAQQVTINYNRIKVVHNFAFNGSEIATLSLRGNSKLSLLKPQAFTGLKSLQHLDLSGTTIEFLPAGNLGDLNVLKLENVASMKVIPSIYELQNLKEAYLTHPFHCCAFKYPEQHDPIGYAQYRDKIKKICDESKLPIDTGQVTKRKRRKRRTIENDDSSMESSEYDMGYETNVKLPEPIEWTPNLEHLKGHPKQTDHSHLDPLRGKTIEFVRGDEISPAVDEDDFGTFHQTSAEIMDSKPVDAFCGNISKAERIIKCLPEPDALNPCEDIMGSYWLRISVWFVVVLAVMGNLAVITVLLFSGGELTVQRFLICNLAIADIFMGLYLLFIASMDVHSMGSYFNYAYHWQYGLGCQISGFLTMFSSQLSVFTLTVITLERWFAITHAIHLARRIRLKAAFKIMFLGWLYSMAVAVLPLCGVSNYSSTSICLPMEVNEVTDQAYLITVIVINLIAFVIIVFCYAQIYFSLGYETRHCNTRGEMTIAKKMALLVFTDFACWSPVAFFALTALAGYPLIGVTRSKILLVFFYPLNSCANPYLYAIMTAQYRRDFFVLLSKCGLCVKAAQQYTTTTWLPTTNNSNPIPLLVKTSENGDKTDNVSGTPNNNVGDALL